jgi:hypothetical protein
MKTDDGIAEHWKTFRDLREPVIFRELPVPH